MERGERHLRHEDVGAAWNDLLAAEQIGVSGSGADRLRQALTRLGLAEVRSLLQAGEASRAVELITQLRNRSVAGADLQALEEAAKSWVLAREQAARGEFAQGSALLRTELEFCERAGWPIWYPEFMGAMAEGLAVFGQIAEARAAVDKGLASADRGGAFGSVTGTLALALSRAASPAITIPL